MRQFIAYLCLATAVLINLPTGTLPNIPGIPTQPDSPAPGKGFNLLIVEDRANRPDLVRSSPGQYHTMFSQKVEEVVAAKRGSFYRYDKGQDVSAKDAWVRHAMTLPVTSYPAFVLDHDGKGVAGKVPDSPEAFIEVIQKY